MDTEWIKRAWRGEERLWKVFWLYGVLGCMIIGVFGLFLLAMAGTLVYGLFWIPRIAYLIWLLVAQWRCAFNANWKIWGYIIRVLIVLDIIAIPLGLIVGGVLVGQDLIVAAQCRKEAQAYAAGGGTDVDTFKRKCLAEHMHKPLTEGIYQRQCEKAMTDYALGHGSDPAAYIAQNQDYLQKCVQYYKNKTP